MYLRAKPRDGQWSQSQPDHVLPIIGEMAVADIDTAAVMRGATLAAAPEDRATSPTSPRAIFDHARVRGYAMVEASEYIMTTLIKLLKTRFSRPEHTSIDDYLLCDIGLSRIVFEYSGS